MSFITLTEGQFVPEKFGMAAAGHGDAIKMALELKKAGNRIIAFLDGREVHPVYVRVGGFYKVPAKRSFEPLRETLLRARDLANQFVDWTAAFDFPDKERNYTFISLRNEGEYPMSSGQIVSNRGSISPPATLINTPARSTLHTPMLCTVT